MFGWFQVSQASRRRRAQARRGVEVVARDEHRLVAVFEVDADYVFTGSRPRRVVLADADEAVPGPIDDLSA